MLEVFCPICGRELDTILTCDFGADETPIYPMPLFDAEAVKELRHKNAFFARPTCRTCDTICDVVLAKDHFKSREEMIEFAKRVLRDKILEAIGADKIE